jgi:HPt (histidine-containing phosphotransfer) domain-containing protein
LDPALLARFLPRLVESARVRLARGRTLLATATPSAAAQLSADMHTLAGEAAMLGLRGIADIARSAETLAARVAVDAAARDSCAARLDELDREVGALTAAGPG